MCTHLTRDATLVAMAREKNCRGRCYIVSARDRSCIMLTQRLTLACAEVNRSAEHVDAVTVSSMYNAAASGKLVKHKWRVAQHEFDSVVREFEKLRHEYTSAAVLGAPVVFRIRHGESG